jgi:PAS domain S-box-containing protein
MGHLLLVAGTDEELAVVKAAAPDGHVCVDPTELHGILADTDVDATVVGSAADTPVTLVQQVHRALPQCGVVVLTHPTTDQEIRRTTTYAPDMPASLTVLESADPRLPQVLEQTLEASRARRRHQSLLTAVNALSTGAPSAALAPASVGALLAHAPFGVLVGDLDGRLVTWNRWAGDLLGLANDAAGGPIPTLFPTPEYLDEAFALARLGELSEAHAASTLEGAAGTAVEISAAPTRLENGQEAVLVLILDVTARRQAERTRDRLAEHVGLLSRVSEALAGTLDVEQALQLLADQVIPSLADWVSLQTYDVRRNSLRVVVRHRDPALEGAAMALQPRLPGSLTETSPSRRVARGEGPVLIPYTSEQALEEFVPEPTTRAALTELGVASVVAVPLPGREDVLGSMVLVRGGESPAYTQQDLAVAVEVGRRAGVALETVALYAQQRDLAAGLQRSLLTEPPQPRQAEIVVRYVAAAEEAQVGGDWYDAFVQADGGTVLVIGDVVGHDTRAAAAMGQLRALLRGIAYTTGSGPAEMLSRLDAAIEGLHVQTTATGLVVRVEPRGDDDPGPASLRWSNAGHPPPIIVLPSGRSVFLDNDDPDLLLGVLARTPRQEKSAMLEPGATLLLYTDGLIERRGTSLDDGLAALAEAVDRLSGLPLAVMCDRVIAEMVPDPHDDDVALVAVRLRTPEEISGVPQ